MTSLSLPAAELIAQTFGCVLYGIYLVTLGIAARFLLIADSGRWKRSSEIRWIMVVVSGLLFVNSTLDLVVSTITVVQAFVLYSGPGGAAHIFTHGSGWQTMTKAFCVPFQSLLGDGILIYRCWFLWSKSWLIVALPFLIWLANVACAVRFLSLLSQASQGLVISTVIQPWLTAFWSMTICINIMTTSLIVGRIWMVDRENKKCCIDTVSTTHNRRRSTLGHAMRNIIESGMIYTVVSIFTLATYTIQSTLHYPVSALEIHSVGITFNLILIRGVRTPQPQRDTSFTVPFRFSPSQTAATTTAGGDGIDHFALSNLDKESQITAVDAK
ncbi:Carboxylic ester hydrolase [Mycena venus]|uniref:Carboxylic ester hydrolase n=1 Tax=Mycena venus TaxID=2733690 RepID=A0A8H6XRF3_9AGAR|nr:Carboxylic ester hydrolase [Mycena venus]